MFTHVEVIPGKTYATEANMLKAVEKVTERRPLFSCVRRCRGS